MAGLPGVWLSSLMRIELDELQSLSRDDWGSMCAGAGNSRENRFGSRERSKQMRGEACQSQQRNDQNQQGSSRGYVGRVDESVAREAVGSAPRKKAHE